MATDQYHVPPNELSEDTRRFSRMIASLIEEAEAIGWYEQRLSLEKNDDARAIMQNAQQEEFKHFSMDFEFLLRKKGKWKSTLEGIVSVPGDIAKNAEKPKKVSDNVREQTRAFGFLDRATLEEAYSGAAKKLRSSLESPLGRASDHKGGASIRTEGAM